MRSLDGLRTDAEKLERTMTMLTRLYRGCRVRVTCSNLLGCEGLVLPGGPVHAASEGKLPVRLTTHDGTERLVSLRPVHLQLIRGRLDEAAEAAEAAALRAAEEAEAMALRVHSAEPSVLLGELREDLKKKSFAELEQMAKKVEAWELLANPLVRYDRASFREGLAEVLVETDDGADVLASLLHDAASRAEAEAVAATAAIAALDRETAANDEDGGEGGSGEDDVEGDGEEAAEALEGPVFGPSLPPPAMLLSAAEKEEEEVVGAFGPSLPPLPSPTAASTAFGEGMAAPCTSPSQPRQQQKQRCQEDDAASLGEARDHALGAALSTALEGFGGSPGSVDLKNGLPEQPELLL
jgi:hypothetical protein